VVEAAGNPATWKQALAMVRRGGVVNSSAAAFGHARRNRSRGDPLFRNQADFAVSSTPRFFREALGKLSGAEYFGARFRHEEIRLAPAQAFARMKSRSGEIKLAVRP